MLLGRACFQGRSTLAIDDAELISEGRTEARVDADADRWFRPETCDASMALVHVTEDDPAMWDRAERFVYDVYRETGFCEVSQRHWVEETEPFRHGSHFHVVVEGDDLVGAIRTMRAPFGALPIGQFALDEGLPSGDLMELGSLAVSRSLRGLGVANELHRAGVQEAIRAGVPAFCMLVEPWSIDFFRQVYGLPLQVVGAPKHYMGSATVPAVASIDEMLRVFVTERPGMFRWITEGLEAELWRDGRLPILLS